MDPISILAVAEAKGDILPCLKPLSDLLASTDHDSRCAAVELIATFADNGLKEREALVEFGFVLRLTDYLEQGVETLTTETGIVIEFVLAALSKLATNQSGCEQVCIKENLDRVIHCLSLNDHRIIVVNTIAVLYSIACNRKYYRTLARAVIVDPLFKLYTNDTRKAVQHNAGLALQAMGYTFAEPFGIACAEYNRCKKELLDLGFSPGDFQAAWVASERKRVRRDRKRSSSNDLPVKPARVVTSVDVNKLALWICEHPQDNERRLPVPLVRLADQMRGLETKTSGHGSTTGSPNDDDTPTSGGHLFALEGHRSEVTYITSDEAKYRVLSASSDTTVRVWSLTSRECLFRLKGHTDAVTAVTVDPDSNLIVSGSLDHTIRLWSYSDGELQRCLQGHSGAVTCVAVSPASKVLVSASFDKTIRVWSQTTGHCTSILEGHKDIVSSVAVDDDTHTIVSASFDHDVRLWSMAGVCLRTLRGHEAEVSCVVMDKDSKLIVSASFDKTIRIWSLNGQCMRTLRGHTDRVYSLTIDEHTECIISGSLDCSIRVWSIETGECVKVLQSTGEVRSVTFDSTSRTVLAGSFDNCVHAWSLDDSKVNDFEQREGEELNRIIETRQGTLTRPVDPPPSPLDALPTQSLLQRRKMRRPTNLSTKALSVPQPVSQDERDGSFVYYGLPEGQVPCANCSESAAQYFCAECEESFCVDCNRSVHIVPAMECHKRKMMVVKSGSAPSSPKKAFVYEDMYSI